MKNKTTYELRSANGKLWEDYHSFIEREFGIKIDREALYNGKLVELEHKEVENKMALQDTKSFGEVTEKIKSIKNSKT